MEEIWKPVKDYVGLYEVSNCGRVKSLDRVILSSGRIPKRLHKGRVMQPVFDTCRYLRVKLKGSGEIKQFSVHRLVAEAFILNPENKSQVNHIDGVKTNNSVQNLEWVPHSENAKHAFSTGLNFIQNTKGSSNGMSKLDEAKVKEIISLLPNKINADIARMFEVSRSVISNIRYNKSWKSVKR